MFANFFLLDPNNFQDLDQTVPKKAFGRLNQFILWFDLNDNFNLQYSSY